MSYLTLTELCTANERLDKRSMLDKCRVAALLVSENPVMFIWDAGTPEAAERADFIIAKLLVLSAANVAYEIP